MNSKAMSYEAMISFAFNIDQLPPNPVSYPETWKRFYDLGLKLVSPLDTHQIDLHDGVAHATVIIRAPDHVQLSCATHFNNKTIINGSLAQFDSDRKVWELLFAPERIGKHELIVFAKVDSDLESACVLQFDLNVTQLRQPMKFPTVYARFGATKCRLYEPLNGALKKGATVPIHCVIPGAAEVTLIVDGSKWLKAEGYEDPILKRNFAVGTKEVTVYAKYDKESSYKGLLKYSAQ